MSPPKPVPPASRVDDARLEAMARDAMTRAYCPYSRFGVGAALLTKEGSVFTGCNVENAAYGHSICAERTALVKAVSEGHREFDTLVIVCTSDRPAAPCGACRQMLNEFSPDLRVVMAGKRETLVRTLRDLLPLGFGPSDLPEN